MRIKNARLYIMPVLFVSVMISMPAYAQYGGYGTSSITLSFQKSTVTSAGAFSFGVPYTVNLASGNTWGTTISVSNAASLSSSGISVSFSNPSGDPPFSGQATISSNTAVQPGKYSIDFVATGDDPSSSPAVFTLTVASAAPNTTAATSIPASNTTATTANTVHTTSANSTAITTAAPLTTVANNQQQGEALPTVVSILAVIILFVVIGLGLRYA